MSVPYVTAAIETSDPFLDQESGIQVCVETSSFTPFFVELFFLFSDLNEEYPCLIRDYTIPSTRPKVVSPAIFSANWFRRLAPRPILPPALQLRFPFNIVSKFANAHTRFIATELLSNTEIGHIYIYTHSHPIIYILSCLSVISCFKILSRSHKAARTRGAHCRSRKTSRYSRRVRNRDGRSCC